jgi:hypothetical protein
MSKALAISAAVLVLAAGCGSDDDGAPAASHLAPSQTGAGTVATPDLPPPCEPSALRFSAGRPPDGALASIVVTNAGPHECEIDVFESSIADPAMEPDAWLAPAGEAELTLVDASPGCASPTSVQVELVINGATVVVPFEIGPACELSLVAIVPR